MKTLQEFINESVSPNYIMALINGLNYDFSETENMPNNTKEERAKKAKAQEEILINTINNAQEKYKVIGIKEYCNLINKTYSYELDSKFGDIIFMKNDEPILFIDLKVAETDKYLGTPDMISLVNFASKTDNKKYYLCTNINGSSKKFVKANDVWNKVVSKEATVLVSKDRKNISPDVKNLFDKVKLVAPEKMKNADLSKLYDEDYISTKDIRNI